MKIIPPGSIVTVTPGVEGLVSCVLIRSGYVSYEVTCWLNGLQYKVLCEEGELQVSGKLKKQTLGFV